MTEIIEAHACPLQVMRLRDGESTIVSVQVDTRFLDPNRFGNPFAVGDGRWVLVHWSVGYRNGDLWVHEMRFPPE